MPAGVSWSRYLLFSTSALITMFAGAQTVHVYYKPLDDLTLYIEEEKKKREQVMDKT